MTNEISKVGKRWSQTEPVQNAGNYYMSPLLRPYIIETAYGRDFVAKYQNNSYYAEDMFVSEYLKDKKVETILSLCCGFGSVERRFVSRLADVKQCLGLDVAKGALEIARTRAANEGMHCISYKEADLNKYSWATEQYDLVIANGALHHLSNLEAVLEGIRTTLRPGGLLYACEYVGPSYQDLPARQIQIINAAAFLVPPELRARKGLPIFMGKRLFLLLSRLYSGASQPANPAWPHWKRMLALSLKKVLSRNRKDSDIGTVFISPKDRLLREDPSEGVRSAEIISIVRRVFRYVETRPFGGGLLRYALDESFYTRFDRNNPLHAKSLEMLCRLERHFVDTGEIGIDNAFLIARK